MRIAMLIAAGALLLVALGYLVRTAGRAFLKAKGTRVVTCPETGRTVAVELDARNAALAALRGRSELRLRDCSRWPERAGCGQDCLGQIEQSSHGCLLRTIVTAWYAGKSCAICRKPFGEIHWHDHRPCLLNAEGRTAQWQEISVDNLPDILESHRPICWNCHVMATFEREFPQRVVDRHRGAGQA
jgi:hypothetical protein